LSSFTHWRQRGCSMLYSICKRTDRSKVRSVVHHESTCQSCRSTSHRSCSLEQNAGPVLLFFTSTHASPPSYSWVGTAFLLPVILWSMILSLALAKWFNSDMSLSFFVKGKILFSLGKSFNKTQMKVVHACNSMHMRGRNWEDWDSRAGQVKMWDPIWKTTKKPKPGLEVWLKW
jgi:hypothetical protein